MEISRNKIGKGSLMMKVISVFQIIYVSIIYFFLFMRSSWAILLGLMPIVKIVVGTAFILIIIAIIRIIISLINRPIETSKIIKNMLFVVITNIISIIAWAGYLWVNLRMY